MLGVSRVLWTPLTALCSVQNLPALRYGAQVRMAQNQVPLLPGETIQTTGEFTLSIPVSMCMTHLTISVIS